MRELDVLKFLEYLYIHYVKELVNTEWWDRALLFGFENIAIGLDTQYPDCGLRSDIRFICLEIEKDGLYKVYIRPVFFELLVANIGLESFFVINMWYHYMKETSQFCLYIVGNSSFLNRFSTSVPFDIDSKYIFYCADRF